MVLDGFDPVDPIMLEPGEISAEKNASEKPDHWVPVLYPYRPYVDAGGLISYGPSISEPWGILGNYAGRVLRGERPADLPIQQITKIELAINLTSARALSLTIPESLLATADEVIQ
jgi:putative tryptophan/tyrosine transport system substrate-binding protein